MEAKILDMIVAVYLVDVSGDEAIDEPPYDSGHLQTLLSDQSGWLDADLYDFLMDHSFPEVQGSPLIAVTGDFKFGDRSKIYEILRKHQCVPCDAEWYCDALVVAEEQTVRGHFTRTLSAAIQSRLMYGRPAIIHEATLVDWISKQSVD